MATDITVEKVWRHSKSTCVAVVNHSTGTRCGYCSLSMAHPFFGKNYSDDSVSELMHKVDEIINVHGGVTYSGKIEWAREQDSSIPRNMWWFGFDCHHAGDSQDPELINDPIIKKFTIEMNERMGNWDKSYNTTHKSLEYVVEQCNVMAEHLSKFVYNSVDFIIKDDPKDSHLHGVSNVV